MEGVLEALMGLLTPTVAVSGTEDHSQPTENHVPDSQLSSVVTEQPMIDNSITSVNDLETSEKSIQSHLNADVSDTHKTAADLCDRELSAALHCVDSDNVAGVETSDLHTNVSQPHSNVPLSSSNIISESNTAGVMENEDVNAGVITEESLTHSLPPLSSLPLTVPLCPPRYLKLSFLPDEVLVSNIFSFTTLPSLNNYFSNLVLLVYI